MVWNLIEKYREQLSYLVFGVLTTLVNYVVYFALSHVGVYYVVANGVAIATSILFAYVTNKLWVFCSHTVGWRDTLRELLQFLGTRLFSAAVDMALMIVLVSLLHMGDWFAKVITGVLVIVLNYITSKFYTFRKDH